jgi:hypothetical protein
MLEPVSVRHTGCRRKTWEERVDRPARGADGETTRDLINDLVRESRNLMQKEIRLARIELQGEVRRAGIGAALSLGGGLILFSAYQLLMMGIAFILAKIMDAWIAAFIVAGVGGIGGSALMVSGLQRIRRVKPQPKETIETLKEDGRWMKETLRGALSRRRAITSP